MNAERDQLSQATAEENRAIRDQELLLSMMDQACDVLDEIRSGRVIRFGMEFCVWAMRINTFIELCNQPLVMTDEFTARPGFVAYYNALVTVVSEANFGIGKWARDADNYRRCKFTLDQFLGAQLICNLSSSV
jgi:hypothetical protein